MPLSVVLLGAVKALLYIRTAFCPIWTESYCVTLGSVEIGAVNAVLFH